MAPLPVIPNVYRTALEWSAGIGGKPVNVLHFRGNPGSAAGLYTAIDANVNSTMWAFTSSTLTLQVVKITPLDGATATVINSTNGAAKWIGGTISDYIPAGSAVLSLRTALRGPAYRGRVYLPGLPESGVVDGNLLPAPITNCLAAWVTFRTALATAGYEMVVASYKNATAQLVTSVSINSRHGIQRRRQSLG